MSEEIKASESKAPFLLLAGDVAFECIGISVQMIVSEKVVLTTAAVLDPEGAPLYATTAYDRYESEALLSQEELLSLRDAAKAQLEKALIAESLIMVENTEEVHDDGEGDA